MEHYVQMNTVTAMTTITINHNEHMSTLSLSGVVTQETSHVCLFGNSLKRMVKSIQDCLLFSGYEVVI